VFDPHRHKAAVLLAVGDVILTILTFEAAYQTRIFLPLERVFFILSPIKALLLVVALLLWLLAGRWIGVYERLYGTNLWAAAYDSLRQVAFGALGLVTFQFLLRLDISRSFIGLFALYSFVAMVLYRASAGKLSGYIRRQFGAEVFYIIVGCGEKAQRFGRQIEMGAEFGHRLLTFVDPANGNGGRCPAQIILDKTYSVIPLSELPRLLRQRVVDEILFVVGGQKLSELEEIFLLCDEEGVRTRIAADLFPHVHSRLYLDRFGGVPMLTFTATPHDEIRLFVKRVFDVTLALFSLILLGVPMLLLGLLVRLTSRGPAVFSQVRCGLNGRRFTVYKLRSMVNDAHQRQAEVQHLNEKDGPVFKSSKDPRLTILGRYLRRFSIDEWPQFWNILRGDMSFVGPRPAVPDEVEQYKNWQRRRLRMRPGLTCLWAVHGRDTIDFETWMKLDLEYIDNWSLRLDFKILLQSIPRVLAGKGAN
jgi:exopolysaccharide biosynthesis polyprenyl glycosylphosphotransferase